MGGVIAAGTMVRRRKDGARMLLHFLAELPIGDEFVTVNDNSREGDDPADLAALFCKIHALKSARVLKKIESHITDLQSVFGKLASLISDQRSDAMRIDENVGSALDSVEAGQGELLTTLNNLQSGRLLGMKVFAVLMLFAIFFITFVL